MKKNVVAFDRVWHYGITYNLKMYDINGNIMDWFESFLSNRTQKVMYRNNFPLWAMLKLLFLRAQYLGHYCFYCMCLMWLEICYLYLDCMLMTTLFNNAQIIFILLSKILIIISKYQLIGIKGLLKFNNPPPLKLFCFIRKMYVIFLNYFQKIINQFMLLNTNILVSSYLQSYVGQHY